jgi:hypothetical protein
LACSMRSLLEDTKFHQMCRWPSIGSPPSAMKRAIDGQASLGQPSHGCGHWQCDCSEQELSCPTSQSLLGSLPMGSDRLLRSPPMLLLERQTPSVCLAQALDQYQGSTPIQRGSPPPCDERALRGFFRRSASDP